ncbi:MAG TPA: thioredoxin domain-containing protein [candidate division Zixibacteria bacterium]|nr:thioredoxin domain-containing protein [candidate division Zixibacteria bacterium]
MAQTLKAGLRIAVLSALLLSAPARGGAEPLAVVDGIAIEAEEVEKPLAAQLGKLEEQIYNLKRQRLEALINERLLAREAARRGISVPALLDGEVTSKVGLVSEQEVESFFQANRAQLQGDQEKLREQIRAHLQNQKLAQRRQEFLGLLRSKASIAVHLKPPPVVRVEVGTEGAPSRGPENAPVTIIEFSDFHCPFCKRVLTTLAQIESRYRDKVRLVFRDFPIDSLHPGARKAHEAARCANEQGKFWPYHDKLFATAPRASEEELKGYARELGLDARAFESCFGGGKYRDAVQADIEAGRRAGVTGTPAFFINGRVVSGAQPLETFAAVIEDELARGPARP